MSHSEEEVYLEDLVLKKGKTGSEQIQSNKIYNK